MDIQELIEEGQQLSLEEFTLQYAPYFLVRLDPETPEEDSHSYRTQIIDTSQFKTEENVCVTLQEPDLHDHLKAPNLELYPLRKKQESPPPWSNRITIGRTHNNDIVIQESTISKLHGFFEFHAPNIIQLADLHSSNGTFINSTRLEPDKLYPLEAKTTIRLGHIPCALEDAGTIYDRVTKT